MFRTTMTSLLLAGVLFVPSFARAQAGSEPQTDKEIVLTINKLIRQGWEENSLRPSEPADDAEFARRVTLDTIGRIPSLAELTALMESKDPMKRHDFVDRLLDDEGYIRNWTSIWGNLLIGRANNQGGGRVTLDRWLRNSFKVNEPYDQFVRALVTAEGNSDENGAVVFLASHLNEMAVPATSLTARLFLGRQVQCTQCHNHPFNDWEQSQFWGLNAFFRGTRRQGNPNNSVTLTDDPAAVIVEFERRNGVTVSAFRSFFDGTVARSRDDKPRARLAELMLAPDRPYLAQTQVNRMWGRFFGFGFTKPVDDMGPHNAASHPQLLEYLGRQFQLAKFDNRRLIRWLTRSEAYQLTSRTHDGNASDNPLAGDPPLFSHMYLKSFSAEQLYDSLLTATSADVAGRNEEAAEGQRRQWLQQFVQTFGTDENDESTSFNGTIPQAMLLMNGSLTQSALGGGQGSFLRGVVDSPTGRPMESKTPTSAAAARKAAVRVAKARTTGIPNKIEALFLTALARYPTKEELSGFNLMFQKGGYQDPVTGLQDVFWALLNSNEFIINH